MADHATIVVALVEVQFVGGPLNGERIMAPCDDDGRRMRQNPDAVERAEPGVYVRNGARFLWHETENRVEPDRPWPRDGEEKRPTIPENRMSFITWTRSFPESQFHAWEAWPWWRRLLRYPDGSARWW